MIKLPLLNSQLLMSSPYLSSSYHVGFLFARSNHLLLSFSLFLLVTSNLTLVLAPSMFALSTSVLFSILSNLQPFQILLNPVALIFLLSLKLGSLRLLPALNFSMLLLLDSLSLAAHVQFPQLSPTLWAVVLHF